jgi:hypothetical protein
MQRATGARLLLVLPICIFCPDSWRKSADG